MNATQCTTEPARADDDSDAEGELRATVRVLGAVVEELAERIELLEIRERLRGVA